jgi:epoxide hydrolase 4
MRVNRILAETIRKVFSALCLLITLTCLSSTALADSDLDKLVEHGYADSGGVKIHYATLGKGPLVVMIHGFPDFWYTWRDQMEALSKDYQVVAID